MSKKAEEAALKAYPYNRAYTDNDVEYDGNFCNRLPYIEGYEQAEKDLSLTIDDIEEIHILLYAIKNNKQGVFTFTRLSDEQYKKVLRRFKAIKEEKK